MNESVPEPEHPDSTSKLQESAGEAWNDAAKALYSFILVLIILVGRAIQALFVLARPAILIGTVISAGYTSITLFGTILACYGGDLSAVILALTSVIIVPVALIIMAGNYGIWAICLATAGLEFLAHLGLQRAPPIVLALIPVLALSGTIFYFLVHMEDVPEMAIEYKENDDE